MMIRKSTRLALATTLAAGLAATTGCDVDRHSTATGGIKDAGAKPNENSPRGSGSIADHKENSGGPGAPGTTPANPER